MPNGFVNFVFSSFSSYSYKYNNCKLTHFLFKYIILFTFFVHTVRSSLLLGALFQNNGLINTNVDSDEEIVFKHAVYVSNQIKLTFTNQQTNQLTLLHKIIQISKGDQLKTIKKSKVLFY